ncbi:MAG: hypothetical protein H6834_15520 [Planctomycetes bacterium]|nr:hypothetical protein [Planctomycetota bacterium]
MRRRVQSILWAILLCASHASAQDEPGEIQIACDAGIQIFLNGTSYGSSTTDGLTIRDLPAGTYALRAERHGYKPQQKELKLEAGAALFEFLDPFAPDIRVLGDGETPDEELLAVAGSLIIRSEPNTCTIENADLGLEAVEKNTERWFAYGIPPGSHFFTFAAGGRSILHEVRVEAGTTHALTLYFDSERVVVDRGDLAVQAPPGTRISIDGRLRGESTPQAEEILVRDLHPGRYTVRAEKPHAVPQEFAVDVELGRRNAVSLAPFFPVLEVTETPTTIDPQWMNSTATLVVTDLPPGTGLRCERIGLDTVKQGTSDLTVYGIPGGEYDLTFALEGQALQHAILLKPSRRTTLQMDVAQRRVVLVRNWVDDLTVLARVDHGRPIESIAFAPDGSSAYSADLKGDVHVLDLKALAEGKQVRTRQEIQRLAFAPGGKTFLTVGRELIQFQVGKKRPVQNIVRIQAQHYATAVTRSQDVLALTLPFQRGVVRYEVESGRELGTVRLGASPVALAISDDGKFVAGCDGEYSLKVWNAESGEAVALLEYDEDAPDERSIAAVSFTPDGKTLISSSWCNVRLFDIDEEEQIARIEAHTNAMVTHLAVSPDGKFLATAATSGELKLWNLATRQLARTLKPHENVLNGLAFSPDGRFLLTCSRDGTMALLGVAD